MAVYTTLSESQVNALLDRFALPKLQTLRGAGDGVENTTYFLTLSNQQEFVLTLFEMLDAAQLPPYIQLMHHCHLRNLPVPCPLFDISGIALQELAGKPALLFPRASGKHMMKPQREQCAALGHALAHLHMACSDFSPAIPNPCGLQWAEHISAQIMPQLDDKDRTLLGKQLELGHMLQTRSLPRGIIHGDLFRDNVLFSTNHITAIIDFYNAGTDCLLLDIAIAINDWCFDENLVHNAQHQTAILDAYQLVRPLTGEELHAWSDCLQWAACRFWLSRLKAVFHPQRRSAQSPKDPLHYRNLLLFYQKNRL